jgi:hypothetical protein
MTELQQKAFMERMTALNMEEMELAISVFPNDLLVAELGKRMEVMTNALQGIHTVMSSIN